MDNELRLRRLEPPTGKVRMVLDTDTYNEIDDQFAVVHALLSPGKLDVEAIYAAPFFNGRSSSPADGMKKSYDEIHRLLEKLRLYRRGFVFKGCPEYLSDGSPRHSPAVSDLIRRAMEPGDDPLYVIAIGAITNVASALLLEPELVNRIVVVWLGGNALHWSHTDEFNLKQDVTAARIVFDSGVPLVHVPCAGVATHLHTTVPEMEAHVKGRGPIGDYLFKIFCDYHSDHRGWSKVIWDMAAVAYLLEPSWVPTIIVPSPILTDQLTWKRDETRHPIRSAYFVERDPIFRDFFDKLALRAGES